MVWKQRDPLTGADRDALFMAAADAAALGLRRRRGGDRPLGDRLGVGAGRVARLRAGNVQMFFPEANPLLRAGQRDPVALVPDYNAVVEVIPA